MAIGVERPLETVRHIPTSSIADVRHGFRCHATARAGSAYEKQFAVFSGARRIERFGHPLRKARINFAFGACLPFDRENPLTDLVEIGQPHESPFCSSPHIDQNRPCILREVCPDLFHRHVLDVDDFQRLHLRLHSQTGLKKLSIRRPAQLTNED